MKAAGIIRYDKKGNSTEPRACMESRIPVERFLLKRHPENKPQGCAKRLKLKIKLIKIINY